MPSRPREQRPSRSFRSSVRYISAAKLLGGRIRELRKARGWTLYEASDAMDIDLKHFQRLETGSLNVTLVTLVRVAEGLGVEMSALFSSDGPDEAVAGSHLPA